MIHREHDMLPDDLSCGEVLLSITRETDFLIAVGSGTVTDTTRTPWALSLALRAETSS